MEPASPDKVIETYWGNARYDGSIPPWRLEPREGRGFVAIASRSFSAGELICTELPATWCYGWHPFNASQIDSIRSQVDQLSAEQREAFFDMANVFPEADRCAGIYMTNSFDMVGSEEPACGMYLAIARLNHSCTPNVQQTHRPDTKEEVLYASRNIEAGEELNDCYIELRQDTETRRRELQEYYRFHCLCSTCTTYDKEIANRHLTTCVTQPPRFLNEDDSFRCKAKHLEGYVMTLIEEGEIDMALDCALDLIRCLKRKSSVGWSERYMAEAHIAVFHIARSLGDDYSYKDLAQAHIKDAHRWNVRLLGRDSAEAKLTAAYAQQVGLHDL